MKKIFIKMMMMKNTPGSMRSAECSEYMTLMAAILPPRIYYGLSALQHRGQESCGIAVSDTGGPKNNINTHKGMGLVNEVFDEENLGKLKGNIGVGHVRYSTGGASNSYNIQPLVLNYIKGTLMLAHNGNLVNAPELRKELARTGAIFQTTIDTEVIAYIIARERINTKSAEEAVVAAMKKVSGAYSLVISSPRKLIGKGPVWIQTFMYRKA